MRVSSTLFAILLGLTALPAVALAQGSEGTGIGAGVESTLTGVSGPTLTYQTPQFHLEGMLGFHDDGVTEIDAFGRFFWQLHSTAASDFSLGGGLGIVSIDDNTRDSNLHLELGAQIRAFVASNVALSATLGLGFVSVDGGDDQVALVGQVVGSLGISYFFF